MAGRLSSSRHVPCVSRRARLSYQSGKISKNQRRPADVAQLVEQRFCKPQVKGSSPFVSSRCRREACAPTVTGGLTHPALQETRGALSVGATRRVRLGESLGGNGTEALRGGVPEWPKGADCKSAALTRYEGSNPSPTTRHAGVAQLVEHQPSKLRVAGSSPVARSVARVAQSVERVLGKDEVTGSIPVASLESTKDVGPKA